MQGMDFKRKPSKEDNNLAYKHGYRVVVQRLQAEMNTNDSTD